MNVEQERRHRQGAAGILPAVLFSDWSAGKMPAALWFIGGPGLHVLVGRVPPRGVTCDAV